MKMEELKNSKFHIAMFPWFALGHIIPYLYLSNKFAQRGHRITFLLPRKAKNQLQHLNLYPNLITFHPLTVPHLHGLPLGAETASDVPFSLHHFLAIAMDRTCDQVHETLQSEKPDFVFFDFAYWILEITKALGIKSICFGVLSAALLAISLVPARNESKDRIMSDEEVLQPPAGYPSTSVVLRRHDIRMVRSIFKPFGEGITHYERCQKCLKESDAIAIRTCREIEGKYYDYIKSQFQKPVFLTGPVLPENETRKVALIDPISSFLEKFRPESVVFCAFGSQMILNKNQFEEILLGFEFAGLPFLIALKPPLGCKTVIEGFPIGFAERVGERGLICGDWVPQPLILAHPSVGCLVNHCGFGSMWESLTSDCQIVLIPELSDQMINARLLVEELKVGVEVEKEEDGWFSKERLAKSILSVMDKDNEMGVMVRKNHVKLKELLASSGLMDDYVDKFIQDLQEMIKQ